MFQTGEIVRYNRVGVCRIREIGVRNLSGEEKEYYILDPLFQTGAVLYVPCESPLLCAKIQPLLTPAEIDACLAEAQSGECPWERDFRRRSEEAKKALLSENRVEVLRLIRTIYQHKREMRQQGRRSNTTDDFYLKDAENLIFGEFSVVWNKPPEEAARCVREAFGWVEE